MKLSDNQDNWSRSTHRANEKQIICTGPSTAYNWNHLLNSASFSSHGSYLSFLFFSFVVHSTGGSNSSAESCSKDPFPLKSSCCRALFPKSYNSEGVWLSHTLKCFDRLKRKNKPSLRQFYPRKGYFTQTKYFNGRYQNAMRNIVSAHNKGVEHIITLTAWTVAVEIQNKSL